MSKGAKREAKKLAAIINGPRNQLTFETVSERIAAMKQRREKAQQIGINKRK